MKQPTQNPRIATNDASATMTVNTYPKTGRLNENPINPTAKQVVAMLELNRCCAMSSGMYFEASFFKNNFPKRIIGLKPVKKPSKFAINGISKIQYCPVIQVKITESKIVH